MELHFDFSPQYVGHLDHARRGLATKARSQEDWEGDAHGAGCVGCGSGCAVRFAPPQRTLKLPTKNGFNDDFQVVQDFFVHPH